MQTSGNVLLVRGDKAAKPPIGLRGKFGGNHLMFDWLKGLFRQPPMRETTRPSYTTPPAPRPNQPQRRAPDFIPPINGHRFIAIDVETANGDPASICQIGIATCGPDGSILTYGTLIDPLADFDGFNIGVHGITPEKVEGKPTFDEVIPKLIPVLAANTVFQHSDFDRKAIEAACDIDGIHLPPIRWQDSVKIARRTWPDLSGNGGHGLANLKKALGLNFRHHDALEDARASAQIVLLAEKQTGQPFTELLATRRKAYAPAVRAEGAANGPLFGQIAVFTGTLSMTREEAAGHAAAAGITVKTSVSSKTTLLIVGDQDLTVLAGHSKSTKHRRAEELIAQGSAIRIIGETEFLTLIRKG